LAPRYLFYYFSKFKKLK